MGPDAAMDYAFSRQGIADAKAFLSAAWRMEGLISVKLARLDQLREKSRRVHQLLSGMPAGPGVHDRVGDAAADLADLEQEVLRDYDRLIRQQKTIGDAIRRVPDPIQEAVLELRYLQCLPFFRVAMELHYDERQIYRIHEKALRHIALQLASGLISPGAEKSDQPA